MSLELLARECLLGWAAEGIGLLVVDELGAVKQGAVPLVVDGSVGGHVRHDALGFTGLGLFAVGVTSVSHHIQRTWIADRFLGCLCHGQKTAIIGRLVRHLL